MFSASVITVITVITVIAVFRSIFPPTAGTHQSTLHDNETQLSAQNTRHEADTLFDAKNYVRAFDAYAQLSQLTPDNLELHRRIEECALLGDLKNRFFERYEKLTTASPDNAVFQNYLGNAHLMIDPNDSSGNARQCYERALSLDSKFAPPLNNLGMILLRHGDTKQAKSFFDRYVSNAPSDAEGWLNRGYLYVTQLRKDPKDSQTAADGETSLRKALELKPSLPGRARAHAVRGELFQLIGRTNDAMAQYQISWSLNYTNHNIRRAFLDLASGLNPPDDMLTRSPLKTDAPELWMVEAIRALEDMRFSRVEEICVPIMRLHPLNPLPHRLMAEAYKAEGKTNEAQSESIEIERITTANR